jgi:hypothetical protein
VARLDVVIDQACVTRRGVEAFPQILEKNRHEQRADVTRTIASPFAACGWRATVVASLRGEVGIVAMVNLVQWMPYETFGSLKSCPSEASACCGLTGFRPASTSAFHCPKTATKEISPDITAGLSSH